MCSVCWHWNKETSSPRLSIYFNRDERRSRELAKAPEHFEQNGTRFMMPVDPKGGGSWIATNEHGLSLSLLNNYAVLPSAEKSYASRGMLVKALAASTDGDACVESLKELIEINTYAAFSLLIWDVKMPTTELFAWDESKLTAPSLDLPFFTSSSWNTQAVQDYRKQCYLSEVHEKRKDPAKFLRTSEPSREMWSVFMSRESTQTVSCTNISVGEETTKMTYFDRPSETESHLQLDRHSQ
jgi:hypothetical protein